MAASNLTLIVDTSKMVRKLEAIAKHATELAAELTAIDASDYPPIAMDPAALAKRCTGDGFDDVLAQHPLG